MKGSHSTQSTIHMGGHLHTTSKYSIHNNTHNIHTYLLFYCWPIDENVHLAELYFSYLITPHVVPRTLLDISQIRWQEIQP